MLGALTVGTAWLAHGDRALAGDESPAERTRQLLAGTESSQVSGVKEARQKASQLLESAQGEGVPANASRALEHAALEWARLASSWQRTLAAEEAATRQEREVARLRKELKGQKALLEETEARRSRAEGLLLELQRRNDAPAPTPVPEQP